MLILALLGGMAMVVLALRLLVGDRWTPAHLLFVPTQALTPTAVRTSMPSPTLSPTPVMLRTSASSNLWAGPGTNFAIVVALESGTSVLPLGANSDSTWWHVSIPGQKVEGWIDTDSLSGVEDSGVISTASWIPPSPTPSPTPEMPRTTISSNLRAGPSTDFAVVTVLEPGTTVLPLETNSDGTWWHVSIPGQETEGWIYTELLSGVEEVGVVPTASWIPPSPTPQSIPTPEPTPIATLAPTVTVESASTYLTEYQTEHFAISVIGLFIALI